MNGPSPPAAAMDGRSDLMEVFDALWMVPHEAAVRLRYQISKLSSTLARKAACTLVPSATTTGLPAPMSAPWLMVTGAANWPEVLSVYQMWKSPPSIRSRQTT